MGGRDGDGRRTLLLGYALDIFFATVGVDLLFCKVVGTAAGDDERAPADPVLC